MFSEIGQFPTSAEVVLQMRRERISGSDRFQQFSTIT